MFLFFVFLVGFYLESSLYHELYRIVMKVLKKLGAYFLYNLKLFTDEPSTGKLNDSWKSNLLVL